MQSSWRTGWLMVVLLGSTNAGDCGRTALSSHERAAIRPPTRLEDAVREAYATEFGETVLRPAIFNDPSVGCGGHITTATYLRRSSSSARLLYLYITPDGGAVVRKGDVPSVLIPAGRFRVLTVIVRRPETIDHTSLPLWEAAQERVNRDHASYAASRGLRESIVSFENRNVFVDAGDIADPRSFSAVLGAAERRGIAPASYQVIASLNLDPNRVEGGFASAGGRFVYMGNYSKWSRPLTAAEWINVANAVYHHEVGHLWGWPGSHDWAFQCRGRKASYRPFIIPPVLLGWEDLDGDQIPEILDPTPHGRSR